MKHFDSLTFDLVTCRREVEEFRALLAPQSELGEAADILPHFRARRHMASLLGTFHPRAARVDRIAHEFDLFGDFAADLAVGDFERRAYCFVEFEGAGPRSLFAARGAKATREWSRQFEHAFSQIVDWLHKLDSRRKSDDFLTRFGHYDITYTTVLVIGRDCFQELPELRRLEWRSE